MYLPASRRPLVIVDERQLTPLEAQAWAAGRENPGVHDPMCGLEGVLCGDCREPSHNVHPCRYAETERGGWEFEGPVCKDSCAECGGLGYVVTALTWGVDNG